MKPSHNKMTPEEIRALVASAPKNADERYKHATSNLNSAPDAYSRWCALGAMAKASLEVSRLEEAETYAEELRALIPSYPDDWNYGNAIQDTNVVLGVIALRSGDIQDAQQHLLEAGRSPGSPQMNSFGPNMTLAKALIEADEASTILPYFELCRVFWKSHRGRLDEWSDEVSRGILPDFGPNMIY